MISTKFINLPICPIDDVKAKVIEEETSEDYKLKCHLASMLRLIDVKGYSRHIYNFASLRCSEEPNQYYTNPFGLLFSEMSASKIIKVDQNGNIVDHGSTTYGYSQPALCIQSAIFKARSDINCIVHLNEPLLTGVASTKQGFLPLSLVNLLCSDIAYEDFGLFDENTCERYIKTFGDKNRILVIRNHTVIVCGKTIEETYFTVASLIVAAKTQCLASSAAKDLNNLVLFSTTDSNLNNEKISEIYSSMNSKSNDNVKWKFGEIEYEAEMRQLDAAGFKTNYMYKHEKKW